MIETTSPSKRPSVPMGEKTRKWIALAAATWTVVGTEVAITRLPTLEGNVRTLLIGILLFALIAGIGGVIFALRGNRRASITLLVLSSIYPGYFSWVLRLIPIALIFYLMFDSWKIATRNHLKSRRRVWLESSVFIVAIGSLVWLQFHADAMASTETKRAQYAFQQLTDKVSKREGAPTPWLTPERAGDVSYLDGSKASLWVPKPSPEGERSDCFYVDQTRKGVTSGFIYFGCTPPHARVILQRQKAVVVGFISGNKVSSFIVTSAGITVKVPVTFGYFLLPSTISEFPLAKFAFTYSQLGRGTCKADVLLAPGSSNSVGCVIA